MSPPPTVWIRLNGRRQEVPEGLTVRGLLDHLALADATVAVAVDEAFVPRSDHATRRVLPEARVEIVAPMQGG